MNIPSISGSVQKLSGYFGLSVSERVKVYLCGNIIPDITLSFLPVPAYSGGNVVFKS